MDIKVKQIAEILLSNGWTKDRFGNFKTTISKNVYRVKIQDASIRYELQWERITGEKDWINLRSDYIKNILIDGNNIVIRGKRIPL